MRRYFNIILILLFSVKTYSQFDRKQEARIKLADDSLKQVSKDFTEFYRVHYGVLLGCTQGYNTEVEFGIHRTITDSDKFSSIGFSASYLRNLQDNINSFCFSGWFGLVGLIAKTNTKDFKNFSYSVQPLIGVEYKFLHLFYGYNINIDGFKTKRLNTHSITLRSYFWFITKRGKPAP